MRLSRRISLIIIPFVTVPLILVGIYSYYLLWHRNIENSHAQLEYYVDNLSIHFHEQLTNATVSLKTLSKNQLLEQYLLTENEQDRYMLMQKPLLVLFASIQNSNPKLKEISLLLNNGYEELRVSNRNAVNFTEDESQSAFFKSMAKNNAGFYYYVGNNADTKQPSLYVSVPVVFRDRTRDTFTAQPVTRGYLTAVLELNELLFRDIPAPWDKATTLLADADNIYLLHSTSNTITNVESKLTQLNTLPFNQWSSTTIEQHSAQHYAVDLLNGLVFHVYIPEGILLSSSLSINSFILALAVLILIIAIPLMIRLLHHYLLQPIESLNLALTQLLQNGSVDNLPPSNSDELNELVDSFNHVNNELYRSNQRIRNLAYIDSLTGLPNRTLFQRNLLRAINYAECHGEMLALLYLDLDNFKFVNDNMGQTIGDTLLQSIAKILRESLRSDDMATRVDEYMMTRVENDHEITGCQSSEDNFSRLGGDEFTILLPHLKAPYQASIVAQRMIDAIKHPITVENETIYITGSIGIAIWGNDTHSADELITCADQAMYQAKQNGKNRYCYFSPTISKQTKDRAKIEQRLYRATEHGQFEMYYQAIVDSVDLKICSYEALIRWNDQELGQVSPDKFIPIAEENGSINRIGSWVIDTVCAQIRDWRYAGYKQVKVGINLSALQVNDIYIVKEIDAAIRHYDIPYDSLYVELTESSVIKADARVMNNLKRLREMGIKVALDDFGTGYSSLGYLRTLPIDILKIDRSFINGLHEGNNSTILSAIITLAHALNLRVIMEGIEEQEQLNYLPKNSDVLIQGYLFSKPKPAAEAILLLKEQKELNERWHSPN